jgi:hypothetical protein
VRSGAVFSGPGLPGPALSGPALSGSAVRSGAVRPGLIGGLARSLPARAEITGIGTVSASGSTPCPRQEGDSTGTAGCGPRSGAGPGRSKAVCWEFATAGGDWLAAGSGLAFIAARMRASRDCGTSGRDDCVAGQRSFVAPGTRRGSAGTRLSSPMRPKPPGAALTGWRDPSTHSAAHVESLFNPNDRLLFNCVISSGASVSPDRASAGPPSRPRPCVYQRRELSRPGARAPWAPGRVLERLWLARPEGQ